MSKGEIQEAGFGEALVVLLSVWALLAVGLGLEPVLGRDTARLLAFAGAAALVLWREPGRLRRVPAMSGAAAGLMLVAGLEVLPLGSQCLAAAAADAGLAYPQSASTPGWAAWVVLVVLAPLCEETLYRQIVFAPALRRFGAIAAVVGTAALFAVSHLHPAVMAGAFALGLVLGVLRWATGSITLGLGLHAGLNLAIAEHGFPAPPEVEGWGALGPAVVALCVVAALFLDARARREPAA